MDERLLIPATRALLEGWCGPVMVKDEDDLLVTWRPGVFAGWDDGSLWAPLEHLRLDLSRAECRDRVARVVAAGRWPMQVQSTALRWGTRIPEERAWVLGGAWVYTSCVEEPDEVLVTALADLDPTDDTRLSDGSRLVDALALAAVARQVLSGDAQ